MSPLTVDGNRRKAVSGRARRAHFQMDAARPGTMIEPTVEEIMDGTVMALGDFSAESGAAGSPFGQLSSYSRRWDGDFLVEVVNPFRIELSSMAPREDTTRTQIDFNASL